MRPCSNHIRVHIHGPDGSPAASVKEQIDDAESGKAIWILNEKVEGEVGISGRAETYAVGGEAFLPARVAGVITQVCFQRTRRGTAGGIFCGEAEGGPAAGAPIGDFRIIFECADNQRIDEWADDKIIDVNSDVSTVWSGALKRESQTRVILGVIR